VTDKLLDLLKGVRVKRGEYRILYEDGSQCLVEEKPNIAKIQAAIKAAALDSVNFPDFQVMLVDDTGMIDRRPVNPKATELYRAKCKPGTVYCIHGPAVLVHDMDFA
jgi:hypothetical protein